VLVKPGGRLVYVTCSVLMEENEDRLAAFLGGRSDFAPIAVAEMAAAVGLPALAAFAAADGTAVRLTPRRTGTDGFFIAAMRRNG
jgi:16S rRNA (cytosine967-C5)-methyltransferase